MGGSGARSRRDAGALHRLSRERQLRARAGQAGRRHSPHRRTIHAGRSVLHDPALQPARLQPRDVSAERFRPRGAADLPLARRSPADARRGAHRRLRVLGQPPSAAGAVRQRTLDRRAAARGARSRGREERGARVRLLRRRSRRRGSRVPDAEIQGRTAVRPQPVARPRVVGRTVSRLRAERRAAHEAPGLTAPPDRAGMVRRLQRQVALADPRSGRAIPRQVPGALVPHVARAR